MQYSSQQLQCWSRMLHLAVVVILAPSPFFIYLPFCLCLSARLLVCLSVYVSIFFFICLSVVICASSILSVHPPTHQPILSVIHPYPPIHPPAYPNPITHNQPIHPPAHPNPPTHPPTPTHPSIHIRKTTRAPPPRKY